jgi:hypothetical protein
MHWYPGFAQVRSVFRFAIFVQLMIVLLAVLGLREAGRRAHGFCAIRFSRATTRAERRIWMGTVHFLVVAMAVFALLKIRPSYQKTYSPPSCRTQQAWIGWLCANTPENSVIAHLPFPADSSVSAYEQTALWMYYGTYHHRRLVNGYSGFFPQRYLDTRESMTRFPDEASLRCLQRLGVNYCVIQRTSVLRSRIQEHPTVGRYLQWLYGDDSAELDIYRLQ